MSRVGKKPIEITEGIEVAIDKQIVKIKGAKAELEQSVPDCITVAKKDSQLLVSVKRRTKNSNALWGLTRALLQNAVLGVSQGFEKKLEIIGVGYKANLEGEKILNLAVGFSHLVKLEVPEGIKVLVEKNIIIITGFDKEKVGQFAAKNTKYSSARAV